MSLAELALAAGYADQAHMTRDVGEFSTLTPLEIRRQIAA
jgi:transcriptional regulator GlxA family with amidase domain